MSANSGTFKFGDKTVDMPIRSGTIGPDVVDIGKLYNATDCFTFDPGFLSTAACESKITYIDGDQGILLHRGFTGSCRLPSRRRISITASRATPWSMTR